MGNCDNKKIPVLKAFKDDDGGCRCADITEKDLELGRTGNDKNQEII